MAREGLTGSRIRERRSVMGLKQATLARELGISASYLNLIEHNRRRIGGKLLLDIASVLGVEPSMLTEGAEAALIATLREAADAAHLPQSEVDRVEEFAGRFSGWAEVLATGYRRMRSLERTIEALNDRLAHDPDLAASVHEVLSTAASIRSTAAILVEEDGLDPVWRNRFHANINEDSQRLAQSSKALAGYLDAGEGAAEAASSPQEEVEAFLSELGFDFAAFEEDPARIASAIDSAASLRSNDARKIARRVMAQVEDDFRRVPVGRLRDTLGDAIPDPVALSETFSVPVSMILRRLASIPELEAGLVVCDRSGSLLLRKPAPGFVIPRYGAACALWPLFAVLHQPGRVEMSSVVQLGRGRASFECFAVADVREGTAYNASPLLHATMLVLPRSAAEGDEGTEVGSTCRVCPRGSCAARREPSILTNAENVQIF